MRPEGVPFGCDGSLPASDAISVVNDARRVLAGRSGGLTASQLRMLLSALKLAGQVFFSEPRPAASAETVSRGVWRRGGD